MTGLFEIIPFWQDDEMSIRNFFDQLRTTVAFKFCLFEALSVHSWSHVSIESKESVNAVFHNLKWIPLNACFFF